MVDIIADSATEVVDRTIDFVMERGDDVDAFGGTIPENLDDEDSPNDFEREMREYTDGFSFKLTNPRNRWTEYGGKRSHWPGITLRETEDDLYGQNPGMTPKYSKVYRQWLNDDGLLTHTYGERMLEFGKEDGVDFNQWEHVKQMLLEEPSTRKAKMSFSYPPKDLKLMLEGDDNDAYVPCNVDFQPRVVDGKLNWHTFCRSKDTLLGIPENIFTFTLLQELLMLELNEEGLDVELGKYVSHISNVHLYGEQIENGYINQEHPDPYDYMEFNKIVCPTFNHNQMESEFTTIDVNLQEGKYDAVIDRISVMDDPWWKSWKAALAAEWIRMNPQDDDKNEERYEALFELIQTPWRVSLAKRAEKAYDSPDWNTRNVPDEFHSDIEYWGQ